MLSQRSSLARAWLLLPFVLLLTVCAKTEKASGDGAETPTETATPTALNLWAGVPALEEAPGDLAETIEPRPGPPRPTQGERIELPFAPQPGKHGPEVPPGTKLEVLRYGPEGAEGLVNAVRVAFNQPMVPIASVESLKAAPIPLEIVPKPAGKARWLGTTVLAWEPEGRMPWSTTYQVTVPAGIKAMSGETLAAPKTWSFSTPTLALESASPSHGAGQVELEPTITLVFNQPIERTALTAALGMRGKGKAVALEVLPPVATKPEDEADKWRGKRTLRLRPKAKLTPNTTYTLSLPAGVYGEGPNRSPDLRLDFTTYPPLRLSWRGCRRDPCWASHGINLESTTQVVDPALASKVHVTPPVDEMTVSASWRGVHIAGRFEGGTRYAVSVDADVTDGYGQTLAAPFKASIKLGPPFPELRATTATSTPAVIERAGSKDVKLRVAGLREVEVSARALDSADIPQFLRARPHGTELDWPLGRPAATWDATLDTSASLRRGEDFAIDLDAILTGSSGAVWMTARSPEVDLHGWKRRLGYTGMFEVTDLGVAAVMERGSGTVLVTRLSDGSPVRGASLKVLSEGTSPTTQWSGTTDEDGLAHASFSRTDRPALVVAETTDDSAFLVVNQSDLRNYWGYPGAEPEDNATAFMYTDRTPYKPGDTIHLAGIVRKEVRGSTGGIAMWATDFKAPYEVTDPRGIKVTEGEVEVGRLGTFSVEFATDPDATTGSYTFQLTLKGLFSADRPFYHAIPVESYRAPEFTVAVERPESTPLIYGGKLVAQIKGNYLHGAALVGGAVQWSLTRSESGFTPPGDANRDFHFGASHSTDLGGGFGRHGGFGPMMPWGGGGSVTLDSGTGTLNATGVLEIDKALLAVEPPPESTALAPTPKPAPTPKKDPPPPQASTYTVNATVVDESRQAISGTGSFVVHPAQVYVGLRSERKVLKEGQSAKLSAIAVDLEGSRVSGSNIAVEVVRQETKRTAVEKDGRWIFEYETHEVAAGACALSSGKTPATCDVTMGAAGTYLVRGVTTDAEGRQAHSEIRMFVHGKDAVVWEDSEHRIDLVPDKAEYGPGDRAIIMLRSPFAEARGVVVVEREGIAKQVPVHLTGGSHVVEIPIETSMIPGVTVSALLTRGRETLAGVPTDQDLGRPAAATGRLQLNVVDDAKRIVVEVVPESDRIAPGEELSVTLKTHTTGGAATQAAVAVMVVDEGVLSLLGHQTPDPLSFFHRVRSTDVWMYALQSSVVAQVAGVIETLTAGGGALEAEEDGSFGLIGWGYGGGGAADDKDGFMAPAEPAAAERKARPQESKELQGPVASPPPPPGGAPPMRVEAAMAQPVSLREVFATTAFFDAEVVTDEHGIATVKVPMPENLTTFRIMAVAVAAEEPDRFGNGEATVTVRKPIMVRPSLPRFANFGDRFEASVMVDNLSESAQNVLAGTRGLNVEITGAEQKFVEIPAGQSREVRFSMAAKEVGRMRLQFAVMSNAGRDATEVTIPVHYPATAKAFADYGAIDTTTQRVLRPPNDALPDFGGLDVSLSSTALSGLEGAVEYLVTYPYECAEQTASRILPIFALGDIIEEFPIATVADRARRDALANAGIKRLFTKQNPDGGFGYWGRGESWPYLTNWVVLALLEGKRNGYAVDEDALNHALRYVENFVRHGHETRWGRYYDWTSRAFGLWLLTGEGRGSDLFDRIWAKQSEMPLYARAQMMAVAHRLKRTSERDQIRKVLSDAVIESAKAVHFAERATEAEAEGLSVLMHSSVQTDAIVLMAWLETDPSEPMLPKVMAGIMADRAPSLGGRWGSTHANAWALLSASRYYKTVEAVEPNYTARIWLDDNFGGEAKFEGRSMATVDQKIAMRSLMGAEERTVTLDKDGPGKLYYRLGLRYAPEDLKLPAEDQGFLVYREYEALADAAGTLDPQAVKRDEHGGWIVKAGTDVRVTIRVVARDRASYVVVDDALPAGFEGQNPRFLTNLAAPDAASQTPGAHRWWWPWWHFDHTDLQDDRMLLFADSMPAGVYSYSYTARATTIGTFHLPPIKAEAMYEPERFGHSASSEVRVVE